MKSENQKSILPKISRGKIKHGNILIVMLFVFTSLSFSKESTAQPLQNSVSTDFELEHSISIDFESESYHYFFDEIKRSKHIYSLSLKNLTENKNLPNFSQCQRIKYFKLENISDEKLAKLFINFNSNLIIDNLKIEGTNFDYFNHVISGINIYNLELIDCGGVEFDEFIIKAVNSKDLKSLKINYCNLVDFPEGVDGRVSLEKLDLSYNNILEISDEILKFKKVDSIILNGITFDNFIEEISKLKALNPSFIQIDETSDSQVAKIKNELPGITINTVSPPSDQPVDEVNFGELEFSEESKLTIYSPAYLLYPSLVNSDILNSFFDSTYFETRFNNLNYRGLYSISERRASWSRFYIHRYKSVIPRKISFNLFNKPKNFSFSDGGKQFYEKYPEMRAFKDMNWILDDTITKRRFNKEIRKMNFNDIRVVYNSQLQNFTLILKCDTGYLKMNAYPVSGKIRKGLESVQVQYPTMYSNYLSILSKRAKTFDKTLDRQKVQFYRGRNAYLKMVWTNIYNSMSEEERKLSREEWLKYFYSVTFNELSALQESSPSKELILRTLILKGYNKSTPTIIDTTGMRYFYFNMVDNSNNNIPVASYILINKTNATFIENIKPRDMNQLQAIVSPNNEYAIIGFLYDGSISITNSDSINSALASDKESRLKSDVFVKNLATIGQIFNNLIL